MTTIEYMKRQIEKGKRSLITAIHRSGVTEKEIDNIQLKIGYYEEAVRALEGQVK